MGSLCGRQALFWQMFSRQPFHTSLTHLQTDGARVEGEEQRIKGITSRKRWGCLDCQTDRMNHRVGIGQDLRATDFCTRDIDGRGRCGIKHPEQYGFFLVIDQDRVRPHPSKIIEALHYNLDSLYLRLLAGRIGSQKKREGREKATDKSHCA